MLWPLGHGGHVLACNPNMSESIRKLMFNEMMIFIQFYLALRRTALVINLLIYCDSQVRPRHKLKQGGN